MCFIFCNDNDGPIISLDVLCPIFCWNGQDTMATGPVCVCLFGYIHTHVIVCFVAGNSRLSVKTSGWCVCSAVVYLGVCGVLLLGIFWNCFFFFFDFCLRGEVYWCEWLLKHSLACQFFSLLKARKEGETAVFFFFPFMKHLFPSC